MNKQTKLTDTQKEVFDKLCSKPKKFCSMCDSKLGKPSKEEFKNFKERMWCSFASFRHPLFRSKSYKLCGYCYSEILRKK